VTGPLDKFQWVGVALTTIVLVLAAVQIGAFR
jgi:hypothetical protein